MLDSGLVAAAQQVEVTIDRIREIANSALPNAESDASSKTSEFRNCHLPASAFGEVPVGHDFAHQHQAAHEVFVETIHGVIRDLQEFRQNLLDSMKAHESNDDAVHATLLALSNRYHGHTYHSDQNYARGRQEQGDKLGTGDDGAPAAQDGGPSAAQPAAPAATSPDPAGPADPVDDGTPYA